MAEFVYTGVSGKLKELLVKIRTTGVPQKLTQQHLKSLGFTSSNDASLIGVMKFIGFIDASGIPTSIWTEYRGADHRKVLGRAIRKGYAELFSVYPDANTRANTDLQNVFAQSSSGGADVIRKTVGTFKALVESADFSDTEGGVLSSLNVTPLHQPLKAVPPGITRQTLNSGRPEVHIDIQIHISPESSNDQIDKIFESMSKHLYGRTGS